MKQKDHLPIFGIGPLLIGGIGIITAVFILLFFYAFGIGILTGVPALVMRIIGVMLIVTGVTVWFIGSVKSGMDESIKENRLKTDGIYAWVRNPMYSGFWMIITGVSFMWHNYLLIPVIFINWGVMTAVLKNTEEKWLRDLYGQEYEEYCKRVNRCIPWRQNYSDK